MTTFTLLCFPAEIIFKILLARMTSPHCLERTKLSFDRFQVQHLEKRKGCANPTEAT